MTLSWSSRLSSLAVGVTLVCASASPLLAQTIPRAPARLEAQVFLNQVRLTWDAALGSIPNYRIEAGDAPGTSNLAMLTVSGTQLSLHTSAPSGVYFVRVRAVNAVGASEASNEVAVVVGACPSPPHAPAGVTAASAGGVAALSWLPSVLATSFVLEAGTAPLGRDVFVGDVGATQTLAAQVAPGTYFVRVRARNACGTSGPSPEARLFVGEATAPSRLTAGVVGSNVTLAWNPPGGGAPGGYTVEVGSTTGASNLAIIASPGSATSLTAAGVPPGTYYVRVRALAGGTAGGVSNEAVVTVPNVPLVASLIGFSLAPATAPLVNYEEAGFEFRPAAGAWETRINYGAPLPYLGFTRTGSSNATASLSVSAGGAPFRTSSVHVYSSVTTIPVVLTGMLGPHVVFSMNTTVPNTFGTFARLDNPSGEVVIDRLFITMSNDYAGNPMGIDNLVVVHD